MQNPSAADKFAALTAYIAAPAFALFALVWVA